MTTSHWSNKKFKSFPLHSTWVVLSTMITKQQVYIKFRTQILHWKCINLSLISKPKVLLQDTVRKKP